MIALILAGAVMAAAFIPWAIRNDQTEHLIHTTDCPECETP